jgi:hypothetical protein
MLAVYLTILDVLTKEIRGRYRRKIRLPLLERHFRSIRFVLYLMLTQVAIIDITLVLRGVHVFVIVSSGAVSIVLFATLLGLWRLLRIRFLEEGWSW